MENAKVVVMEDDPEWRGLVRDRLGDSPHVITREATNLEEALTAIDEMASGELKCDVVILDANLSPDSPLDGCDGLAISAKLQGHNLGVMVLGFSSTYMRDYGIQVDEDPTKLGLTDIPTVIDEL